MSEPVQTEQTKYKIFMFHILCKTRVSAYRQDNLRLLPNKFVALSHDDLEVRFATYKNTVFL